MRLPLIRRLGISSMVGLLVAGMMSAPALAGVEEGIPSTSVALQSLLRFFPGSTVYSSDTIRIRPGVLLTLPKDHPSDQPIASTNNNVPSASSSAIQAQRPVPPRPDGYQPKSKPTEPATATEFASRTLVTADTFYWHGCQYYYLCLFSEMNFTGYKLSLYYCGFDDLGQISFPGGGRWNDKTSSIVNYQSPNTESIFYNWDGIRNWIEVDRAWSYPSITGAQNRLDGVSWGNYWVNADNKIDGVHVC